jgi:hypothetical protein
MYPKSASFSVSAVLAFLCSAVQAQSPGDCIADETINTAFAQIITGTDTYEVAEGSCCQETICGLGCPEEVPPPAKGKNNPHIVFNSSSIVSTEKKKTCGEKIHNVDLIRHCFFFAGFGIVVIVAIVLFVLVGFSTVFFIKNKSENYFVAGRSLPLWVVVATLASQSIDSNALLGNADLSYKYHFYDGAVLPIGLGLSLVLNGVFLAAKINKDGALTLPDVFAKRYGKFVEILASICTIISFLCLLAGNLVGMGVIISYTLSISEAAAIWVSA